MPEVIKVIEEEGQRLYDVPDIDKLPSVTTITGLLDKSTPLMYWAAGLSFDYVRDLFLGPLKDAMDLKDEDKIQRIMNQFYDQDVGFHYKKAKSYHTKKSKEARDIGTYVHEAAEAIFRAMLENSPIDIPIDEDIERPVKALLTWIAENDVTPVLVEQKVWAIIPGLGKGCAGRLDLVAYVNERLTTIDLKAAKGIYADGPLQVAAYDFGYNSMVEGGLLQAPGPTVASAILRLDKETGMPEYVEYSRDQTDDYFKGFSMLCGFWHMDKERKENDKIRKKEQRDREKAEKKIIEKTEDPY